ncbi:nickel pincer cofactor biosynthesis protein LarB [Loktanella salsilacus]|uniref:nickel pincer cofactor biosynthesis protein LarB n=1 Tax=Loktanella salsilacus TaxID=195913 RepID=UPI0020B6CF3D|nr:nickel pincer cofactor biosynthesis protein LarB [Loktanella salsilacus]UTH46347.1 nickel pincer cofactor biosynthesis protein LarB [Loktanella salsilacus]
MDQEAQNCLDWAREARTGIAEAVFAESKTPEQMLNIVRATLDAGKCLFVTRLSVDVAAQITRKYPEFFGYDADSRTGVIGQKPEHDKKSQGIVIVAAGTSDMTVAKEAAETLRFNGFQPKIIADVGVAGLWRLLERIDEIREARVVIAVAGMEGALFSVLGGLISAPVIAVPTSVGYGVSHNGKAALSSALATCSPGIVTVNIDNGFGAAVACIKMLRAEHS